MTEKKFVITTFYKMFDLSSTDAEILQRRIKNFMQENDIKGTVLLGASEGVNSTIAGSRDSIDKFYDFVKNTEIIKDMTFKESFCDFNPFEKVKVKIKKEIVTIRSDEKFDFLGKKGNYVAPKDWDEFISRDDVVVLDSRNDYEYYVGTFDKAINPDIKNFRDIKPLLKDFDQQFKDKKIATFCTGGIRCEKMTAWMMQCLENQEVYHLEGGILAYFEQTGNQNKKWKGHCFVFDNRIAVDDQLNPV